MTNKQYFHFTLGPVQSFVSQARRTRDFWAGSFLLSWLSAVAIQAVKHQGNDNNPNLIKFPEADEIFLNFLTNPQQAGDNPPKQGSIPNRFKAEIANIDDFDPKLVTDAVQEAWKALTQKIWDEDIASIKNSKTYEIWQRQIKHFWDISWVVTEGEDNAALDKRKNCRSYSPPNEGGVKCSMMNGWQELSGEERPNRKEMNANFWTLLRESGKPGIKNDLAENEALCAIAYVKRRFSRYFNDFSAPLSQGWTVHGWKVPSAVPSVSYLAAVHWIEQATKQVDSKLLDDFSKEAKKLIGHYGEWETSIQCLVDCDADRYFSSLDGNVFYQNNLENSNLFPDQKQASKVVKLLREINNSKDMTAASPFYAVLMMDGDSLGKNMSDTTKQDAITKGLASFTKGVLSHVEKNNGFLIYAGGDDVLAILPLEDAIPCATALRTHYDQCFNDVDAKDKGIETSLSGAIEFVHNKTPLTKILHDAHSLLDDIAKEKTGRDALAIRVWKPGGLQLEWSQPWDVALTITDKGEPITWLEKLVGDFKGTEGEDAEQFSNKFLYKIRERFELLDPTGGDAVLSDEEAVDLMSMEYLNSGKSAATTMAEARTIIKPLLAQCRIIDKTDQGESSQLKADGALLIRFLAQKGAE